MSHKQEISRRSVLGVLAGSGTALVLGCGGGSSNGGAGAGGASSSVAGTGGASSSTTTGTSASTGAGSCAVTPEGEIGPYFTDDSDSGYNRSNIVANLDGTEVQVGIPLTLTLTVVDTEKGCAPYANAQIDVWHCNAAGVYSNEAVESTVGKSWLRGYQITDAHGRVTFTTVVPGWYSGRTTHVHVRVRSSYSEASSTNDGTNTTQLFFDQALIDTLETTVAPYSSEGQNPTTNASDHVYASETLGGGLLTLTGDDANGYTASVTIGLPIKTEGDGGGMGGPPGGGGGPPGGGGP